VKIYKPIVIVQWWCTEIKEEEMWEIVNKKGGRDG